MFVTFYNRCDDNKMVLCVNSSVFTLEPQSCVDIPVCVDKISFSVEILPVDLYSGFEKEETPKKLKDRILFKLAKKFAEKLPEMGLYANCDYELSEITNNTTVDLYDGVYSVADGNVADYLFDMVPVVYCFARVEAISGKLKFVKAHLMNRKKYLKLVRNLLLFIDTDLFFPNLVFFIPKYILTRFYATGFFLSRILTGLYRLPVAERVHRIDEKSNGSGIDNKKGCLSSVIKTLIAFAVVIALVFFIASSEPDVIVSKNFKTVECFDEVFVQIAGGLPDDAERVFFQDYSAYYPLSDDEYDIDSYYCYIYEDSNGERYMWLKDGCDKPENEDKDYDDYEKPLVYKSIGEKTE